MPSWRGAQLKHRDNFTFPFMQTFIQMEVFEGKKVIFYYWNFVLKLVT
jgi:hypothetical protein